MKCKFLTVNGTETRVLFEGEHNKEALVLIHGFGSCAETWINNIDALGRDYYVIVPDLIGHGFTAPVDLAGGPPHPKAVAHLFGVLDALGIDRFVPSGSSYGGLLAALMYFQAPQRVKKLVINGSGSTFNSEAELAASLKGTYANGALAFLNPTLETCRKRSQGTVYDPASAPETMVFMRLTSYSQPWMVESWRSQVTAMMDIDKTRPYRILERLERLDVETMVVWGREDPRGVYASAVKGVQRMPKAKLVTFEKCGHLPFLEQPERYNRDIRAFLAGGLAAIAA